jgi:lipid-A-disaccharide synthase
MAAAAATLQRERPGLRVRLVAAPGLDVGRLRELAAPVTALEVVTADRHRALLVPRGVVASARRRSVRCSACRWQSVIACTADLRLARRLVRVPHVALVNLVAGRRLVGEFVQDDFTVAALVAEARGLLSQAGEDQREALDEVRRRLGPPGASERAARAVLAVAREGR